MDFLDENSEFFSFIFFQKFSKNFFATLKKLPESRLTDVIRNLFWKTSCWNRIMIDMRRKGKGMELCNLKLSNDVDSFLKIRFRFSWKPYNEISSEIESYLVLSFYISEFCQYLMKRISVIVSIHCLQDCRTC